MTEIFVVGDLIERCEGFACDLARKLGASVITKKEYSSFNSNACLVFSFTPYMINSKHPIIIIKGSVSKLPKYQKDAIILLDSSCRVDLEQAGQVITVGYGKKDTVSISSIGENKAVMSVLRPIKSLTGVVIGPLEMAISTDKHGDIMDTLLMQTAQLIYC